MKKTCFIITLLLNTVNIFAQDYPAAVVKIQRYFNNKQADSLFNMGAPNMKAALPLDKTVAMIDQLHSQLGEMKTVTPLKEGGNYKAIFTNGVFKMLVYLNADNQLEGLRIVPYQETKDSDNVVLNGIHGTLTVPDENKVPVVLLIAGSGPTDRNGNSASGLKTNSFLMIADSLKRNGIACLRYDKRSVGASDNTPEKEMKFEDLVNDAIALIKMLKADPRFSKVFVAGHSEGSLIGMIAAKDNAEGFISIAGAGERADLIIEKQLSMRAPANLAQATSLFDSLRKGYTVQEPANGLKQLFRTSAQPYMMSWLKFDPQTEIKKLKIPVLIIQGSTDIQVSTADAALLKKAKPDAALLEIEGMNHILKTAPADQAANLATYNQPDLPVKKELTDAVVKFVNQH
jgi:uncharacterized protein